MPRTGRAARDERRRLPESIKAAAGDSRTARAIDFAVAVSAIPLTGFLGDLDPAECKLHCAVWNHQDQPIDVLARSWDEWVGWNSWRPAKDEFNRQFIFSLAQMVYDHPTHWLFGGVFEVVHTRAKPHALSYDVQWREDFLGAYVKRLQVGFKKPGRNIRLKMEKYVGEMEVVAILPEPYAGEPFPGLDQINHTLSQLEVVFAQQRAIVKSCGLTA